MQSQTKQINKLRSGMVAGQILQNKNLNGQQQMHLKNQVNRAINMVNTSKTKLQNQPSSYGSTLNITQGVLDVVGIVPPFGWIADVVSMVISLLRKEFTDAFLSAVSIVPLAGNAVGKPIKYIRKAIRYLSS